MRRTFAEANLPSTSWGMVVPVIGMVIMAALGVLLGLLDGLGHFVALAVAEADAARRSPTTTSAPKAEAATALHRGRRAVHADVVDSI
jgi:hypothetical protein